jgi:peroxiredoxin
MNRLSLLLLIALLFFLPLSAGAVEVGKPAPGFTLKTLDGETVSLADYKGKVVLLKLATTWCPSCGELTRELVSLGDFLKEKDVVLIEVFVQDSPEMVKTHLRSARFPITHKVMLDDDMQVYRAYAIYGVPRFLVLDRELKVRFDNGAMPGPLLPAEEIKRLVTAAGS